MIGMSELSMDDAGWTQLSTVFGQSLAGKSPGGEIADMLDGANEAR
jgi:hypothetical protein